MVYQSINGNGTIFHGYQVVALTLLMQWGGHMFLYVRNKVLKLKPSDEPEGYYGDVTEDSFIARLSVLGVCGMYVTAGISKHRMSKGKWFEHAEYFITNLMSVNEREYYNKGNLSSDFNSVILPQILSRYPVFGRWFFGLAFYMELAAPLFVYNRFTLMVGGVITWLMHEGIAWSMRLTFVSHQRILLAYFIDPLYWIQVLFQLGSFYSMFEAYRERGIVVVSPGAGVQQQPQQHQEKAKDEDKDRSSNTALNDVRTHGHKSGLIKRGLAFVWRFPFKSMVLLILLCFYFKEVFPFSNFPMYGVPPQRGDYFYITDKDNQPLFTSYNFMMTGAQMKRSFFTSCKKYLNTNTPMMFRKNSTAIEHCGNQSLAFFNKIMWPKRRHELEWRKPWSLNWVFMELQKNNLTVTKQTTVIARLGPDEEYRAQHPIDMDPFKPTKKKITKTKTKTTTTTTTKTTTTTTTTTKTKTNTAEAKAKAKAG